MKAITLTQPWAWLVEIGAKRFETRSWQTHHIGPLAIHAAKGMPSWVPDAVEANPAIRRHLDEHGLTLDVLPRGAVVAVAHLEWAEPTSSVLLPGLLSHLGGPDEVAFGDYSPGRSAWYLSDIRPLPVPVPAKGALWLWEWTLPAGWARPGGADAPDGAVMLAYVQAQGVLGEERRLAGLCPGCGRRPAPDIGGWCETCAEAW